MVLEVGLGCLMEVRAELHNCPAVLEAIQGCFEVDLATEPAEGHSCFEADLVTEPAEDHSCFAVDLAIEQLEAHSCFEEVLEQRRRSSLEEDVPTPMVVFEAKEERSSSA
jgi:hypothetical protein